VTNEPWTEQGNPAHTHSFEADGGSLSLVTPDEQTLSGSLESFSVKAPSEHHFDGRPRDIEVQFKHSNNLMLSVTFQGEALSSDEEFNLVPAFHTLFDSIMSGDYSEFDLGSVRNNNFRNKTSFGEMTPNNTRREISLFMKALLHNQDAAKDTRGLSNKTRL